MKETSIIILALIALCAALFVYNEMTGGEIEDIIAESIAKDTIIEAKIPKTEAALSAAAAEKATGVKYVSLENATTGKVLSVLEEGKTITAAHAATPVGEVITRYVIMRDLETDAKVCFALTDAVELTRKGEILNHEAIAISSYTTTVYIKTIPV